VSYTRDKFCFLLELEIHLPCLPHSQHQRCCEDAQRGRAQGLFAGSCRSSTMIGQILDAQLHAHWPSFYIKHTHRSPTFHPLSSHFIPYISVTYILLSAFRTRCLFSTYPPSDDPFICRRWCVLGQRASLSTLLAKASPGSPRIWSLRKITNRWTYMKERKGPKGPKRSKKDKTAKNNNHKSECLTTQQETDLFGIGAQFWD